MADTFGASRTFRILAVIFDCCCELLCLVGDSSISGARAARESDALMRMSYTPACVVRNKRTEYIDRVILKWSEQSDVARHYIDSRKP